MQVARRPRFLHRVGRFDHWRNDAANADGARFVHVAQRFAAADLDGELDAALVTTSLIATLLRVAFLSASNSALTPSQ